jgi:hypothetical protein
VNVPFYRDLGFFEKRKKKEKEKEKKKQTIWKQGAMRRGHYMRRGAID